MDCFGSLGTTGAAVVLAERPFILYALNILKVFLVLATSQTRTMIFLPLFTTVFNVLYTKIDTDFDDGLVDVVGPDVDVVVVVVA